MFATVRPREGQISINARFIRLDPRVRVTGAGLMARMSVLQLIMYLILIYVVFEALRYRD